MGRFYDALRQARGSVHGQQGGAHGLERESSWEAGAAATAPAAPAPEPAPPIPLPELLAGDSPVASLERELFPPQPVPPNGHLGILTKFCLESKARVLPHAMDSRVVERYRLLRTRLLQGQGEKMFRSVLVTSPSPREGKTVTTFNLGLSLAMLPSCRVLVLEGDLRKGSLEEWLGIKNRPGFSNLLEGSATLEEVVLKSEELRIAFVVRGNSKLPPAELLHSDQLRHTMRQMTEQFDVVLVDSPPVNLVSDTQLLASACNAVLLVARAFATTRSALEESVKHLQFSRILGTVLNGGTATGSHYRYRSYY